MKQSIGPNIAKLVLLLAGIFILAPAFGYGILLALRPSLSPTTKIMFRGIEYRREARKHPRPMLIHTVEIALTEPGVLPLVTPGDDSKGMDVTALTTSGFLESHRLQVAVNGSFCRPAYHNGPFDYYPRAGDPVDVIGLSLSNGVAYSPPQGKTPVLCLLESRRAAVRVSRCPAGTQQALAGNRMVLTAGQGPKSDSSPPEPRTMVALDKRGETLWLVVVDGRQSGYSEGATYTDLANIAKKLGAHDAINLDGGGSSTLVADDGGSARLLNSPINTRIPGRERPVANHLGFYADALE